MFPKATGALAKNTSLSFARTPVAFGNTLHVHLESASHLRVFISAKIVKDAIADLLFHQDDIEGVTQKHAMTLLEK